MRVIFTSVFFFFGGFLARTCEEEKEKVVGVKEECSFVYSFVVFDGDQGGGGNGGGGGGAAAASPTTSCFLRSSPIILSTSLCRSLWSSACFVCLSQQKRRLLRLLRLKRGCR